MTTTPPNEPATAPQQAPGERSAAEAPRTPNEAPAALGASSQAESAQPTPQAMKLAEWIVHWTYWSATDAPRSKSPEVQRQIAVGIDEIACLPELIEQRDMLNAELNSQRCYCEQLRAILGKML